MFAMGEGKSLSPGLTHKKRLSPAFDVSNARLGFWLFTANMA